jgi:hypothetical protein
MLVQHRLRPAPLLVARRPCPAHQESESLAPQTRECAPHRALLALGLSVLPGRDAPRHPSVARRRVTLCRSGLCLRPPPPALIRIRSSVCLSLYPRDPRTIAPSAPSAAFRSSCADRRRSRGQNRLAPSACRGQGDPSERSSAKSRARLGRRRRRRVAARETRTGSAQCDVTATAYERSSVRSRGGTCSARCRKEGFGSLISTQL